MEMKKAKLRKSLRLKRSKSTPMPQIMSKRKSRIIY